MRIRKSLGRSTSPGLRLSVPATKSNGAAKLRPTRPLLPQFTAVSPLHPNSFYQFFGLYKYGTGVLPLSAAMQQRTKAAKVSLKVYATEPASHKDVRAALSSALRTSNSIVNLRSGLVQLYNITAAVLSSSEIINSVFFQTFERFAEPFGTTRTTTHFRNRAWALSIELSRTSSGLSRPLLNLAIVPIFPRTRCKIGGRHRDSSLQVTLRFLLKSSTLGSGALVEQRTNEAEDEHPAGPIQPIVDQLVKQVLQSIKGFNFVNENSMLYKIESTILEYVRSSSLATFVDFHVLEIEVQTGSTTRERFVLNRFLNADGSRREAGKDLDDRTEMYSSLSARLRARQSPGSSDSIALPSPSSADTSSQDIKKLAGMDPRSELRGSLLLSDACQKKTGIQKFSSIFMNRKKGYALQSSQVSPSEILKMFDNLCASTSSIGLSCLAQATALMASQFSDLSARLVTAPVYLPMPHRSNLLTQVVELGFNVDSGLDYFRLRLPPIANLDFSIEQNTTRSKFCQVYLTGRYQKDLAKHNIEHFEHELPGELNALMEMVLIVTEGIAKGVDFESPEIVPLRLAEGLLRTIQFLSPGIVLESVRVRLAFPGESFDGHSETDAEKWREPDVEKVLIGATTSTEPSTVDPETAYTGPCSGQGISRSSEEPVGSETGPEWDLNEAHADKEDWATAAEQDHEPYETDFETNAIPSKVQKSRGLARYSYLEANELELSSNLQSKVGFNTGQFRITWASNDRTSTVKFNSDDVWSLLTNALDKAPAGALQSVSNALRSVVETLPNDTELVFCIKSPIPESFGASFTPGSHMVVFFYNYGSETRTQDKNRNQISISLPGIWNLPVQVEQPSISAEMFLSLYIHFDGTPPQDGRTPLDEGSMSQVRYIMEICLDKTKHTLSTNKFGDLNELTDRVAVLLFDQSDLFKDMLNVGRVRIRTQLFVQDQRSLKPKPLASAQASLSKDAISGTNRNSITTYEDQSRALNRIYIALGSNLGDRLHNIERACREMSNMPNTKILKTSALYETTPMYVEDQDSFLNGVCEIETTLSPYKLLDELQAIEQRMGRVKHIDKGPRNIDLDILLYRDEKIRTDRLTIPHPLMLEREFVLRPLCDIPTASRRDHPTKHIPHKELLASLTARSAHTDKRMRPLTELAPGAGYIHLGRPGEHTRIMSIINLTPDSFSDGGVHSATDLEQLSISIRSQISNGATIVDIGGQSSRPNAADVTAEEELSRILPAIEAIRSMAEAANVAISVDTYRAAVAEAAINAGAHIINDISAGLLDEEMLPTIARLGCTYIMMHMRGTPSTMMSEENCAYPNGLIRTVVEELYTRIQAAQAAGIRRWRIILDPGIGFSKTADQNLEILHNFGGFKRNGSLRAFPWLIGSSRKSFIGKITGVEDPKERGWGTAATVTAAIQGGADIVRVHDAAEMSAVVKMADAIHRSRA